MTSRWSRAALGAPTEFTDGRTTVISPRSTLPVVCRVRRSKLTSQAVNTGIEEMGVSFPNVPPTTTSPVKTSAV